MASSSSSHSAPVFSSLSWSYDVFLSFRGEDTRRTFVDHLYAALERQGINTYKDDVTLPRGERIAPALKKAIGESQIAVIIFSKNYADSSWCLDELAYIMECRDTRGQIVLPIFYDVDPSEVRKQNRKYLAAFAKHEAENETKVESWKKALVDASSVSGWETTNIANGHEAKGIKQIVFEISQKLQPVTSSANENLIGMAARLQGLKSELQIGSGGVRMIGIWGVGGGGKTTLASSLYDEICWQFDGCCFVQNVREESSRHGLEKLQEKILLELEVNKVGGRQLINNRLRQRKVLIVLDDVDHIDQLKALAGSHNWFGEESRVIITTRDKHLLAAHKVNVIHNIRLLDNDEAIKLFCKHAPRDNRHVGDYEHLSKEVVSYAGGLPLALTVLGSFLCDKDVNEWKSALARLKQIPDSDIVEKLKISFNGLKQVEKDMFLDIACFYRGEDTDDTMKKFDAFGFHAVIGVKVLIQKALITISYGRFDMHDLVQEMGHHIVKGEHPNRPEKHSRLWKNEDVLNLCAMDETTECDMIEAIRFRYNRADRLPQIVAKMRNLRSIDWKDDLASLLPTNFSPTKLCCLVLESCSLKQLWEGYKFLPNLKIMELRDLKNLIRTPEFNGLQNLEAFRLEYCKCLEEIHPSIGDLERLVFLSIEHCSRLMMFPPITRLKKLKSLSFTHCGQLFKIPCLRVDVNHIGLHFSLNDLRDLNLSYCNLGYEEMRSAVWELPNLKTLNLEGNKFAELNFRLLRLPRLKRINVSWCLNLIELSDLPTSIAIVKADWCKSLARFADIIKCKWLWSISLKDFKKNQVVGNGILYHMLQGNATEDYFINFILKHQIPHAFEGRMFMGTKCELRLQDDWYNDYNGFLICFVTRIQDPDVEIIMKHEVDEDSLIEVCHESNEAVVPQYDNLSRTCVGYVSFSSLMRHITFSNSSYTKISVEIKDMHFVNYVGVELVPRISKGDQQRTTKVATDFSEYWDHDFAIRPQPFTIKHDSKSSIKINWQPRNRF